MDPHAPALPEPSLSGTFSGRVRDSFLPHAITALTIAPRYDRAIVYGGDAFTGRLTVNAFFRLRMAAA